mgnify:CR=1 FL=1
MYKAKTAINDWFEAKGAGYKLLFLQTLLGGDHDRLKVKAIWYQINEEVDSTTVFTRLNVGKIPLTNGELVKALFLKSGNFQDRKGEDRYLSQLKIAQEWDDIERTLQKDDFWYFLSNKSSEANRIEFILKLIADQLASKTQTINPHDKYYVFLVFSHWLEEQESGDIHEEWKTEFRDWLKATIFNVLFPDLEPLNQYTDPDHLESDISDFVGQLSYENNRQRVVSILLMFNVATLFLNPSSNARFQFDQFKTGTWDIEHIRSVTSDMPRASRQQKDWLSDIIEYFNKKPMETTGEGSELRPEVGGMLEEATQLLEGETFNSDRFEQLFLAIHNLYAQDSNGEAEHSIGNLALLDSTTNRSYKNAIFPIKRNRIIALDRDATFVPICTKNVFLKYYSDEVDNMLFWNSRDIECHKSAMTATLRKFFKDDKGVS